jgi:predicted Zn finger-like uncharacterized protein
MSTVRLRRLQADFEKLQEYVQRHPRLRMRKAQGNPPELYELEFLIRGLRQTVEGLAMVTSHLVEIQLPRNYPRTPPVCRMLTPVFHPNIAPHAICVGDHWSAGEPISSIVARIGEMIAFQSYNTKSPLNGEAARWVEQNQTRLPLDRVSMLVDEGEQVPAAPAHRTQSVAQVASHPTNPASDGTIGFACPACSAPYRVSIQYAGKQVRCRRCQAVLQVPAPRSAP